MILWVADIGGTNCRIAEFGLDETKRNAENTSWPTPQDLRLNQDFEVKTSDINSDQDLIACFESYFAKKVTETEGLGLAVAGPIQGDSAKLTNAKLSLNATKLHSNFKVKTVLLLNDFMAQAYACAEPLEQDLLPIGEPRKVSRKVRAILGVGTGLGCAMLVPQGNMDWKGLGSEAGHMPFGFKASEEDFAKWLKARLKKELLEAEDLLSGRGLKDLNTYLTGEELAPDQIAAKYLKTDTPTQKWWSSFYGRFCRTWILATQPLGGLWISGGIAIKNPEIVQTKAFFSELEGSSSDLKIPPIPMFLFKDTKVGLNGCAAALLAKI